MKIVPVLVACFVSIVLFSMGVFWQFENIGQQSLSRTTHHMSPARSRASNVNRNEIATPNDAATSVKSGSSEHSRFWANHKDVLQSEPISGNRSFRERQCERPVTKLVYVKTHKTGSSALRRLLMLYLEKHGKEEIRTNHCPYPFVGGYPGRFRCEFKEPRNATVSVNHVRFDFEEMSKCYAPETRYVTIVRHPWANFQSALGFFGKEFVDNVYCFGMPISYLSNGEQLDVNEFLLKCDKLLNSSVPWYFRFNNYQAHDLGMDPTLTDEDEIQRQIQEIDDNLHLVLINEYMDESLLLLKNLLCMDWNDIAMRVKVPRHSSSYQFASEKHRNIFTKLNKIDIALYDHFNRTLWKKVDAYGREKFARDLKMVRNLRSRVRRDGGQKKKEEEKNEMVCERRDRDAKWWESVKKYRNDNAGECYMP